MTANRISRYLGSDRLSRSMTFQPAAFIACPMALLPAAWAHPLYQAAWEQAKAATEQRSSVLSLIENWN